MHGLLLRPANAAMGQVGRGGGIYNALPPGGLVYREHGGLQNRSARFDSWVPR